MIRLVFVVKKIVSEEKEKYGTFYLHAKAGTIINKSDIDNIFESIYTKITWNLQTFLEKSSSWIINSVIDHNISILNYNPLARSSYIKLPKEWDHRKKGLINVQNIDDNECFKWSLVR